MIDPDSRARRWRFYVVGGWIAIVVLSFSLVPGNIGNILLVVVGLLAFCGALPVLLAPALRRRLRPGLEEPRRPVRSMLAGLIVVVGLVLAVVGFVRYLD